jgi:hypothetical protein
LKHTKDSPRRRILSQKNLVNFLLRFQNSDDAYLSK